MGKLCKPSGPRDAKIFILGEAPGKDEEALGLPFVGASGQELTRMLADAGIDRKECYLTNVFLQRPPANNIKAFCAKKAEVGGKVYPFPPLSPGNYVKPEYLPNLERIKNELETVSPNIVLALGNTACWALLQNPKITSIRGVTTRGTLAPYKVLPTFHPAAILRNWNNRPVVVADFIKAKEEAKSPDLVLPSRELWVEPTLSDIQEFYVQHLEHCSLIAVDIETKNQQITNIGFASDETHALNIPFVDFSKESNSYWETPTAERIAWDLVKEFLHLPQPKIFQNGVYDVQYLWKTLGLTVVNFCEDTMLLHHALQPELPKSLGFLGSIYTNEAAWKNLASHKELKKDD